MSAATTIASVDDIAEGKGKAYDIGEKRIAVFNVAGSTCQCFNN